MPGVPMPLLNTVQPFAGVDVHTSLPPIPPAPAPHVVVWGLGLSGWMSLPLWQTASKSNSTDHPKIAAKGVPVAAGPGHPCGRGHDAGPHLGHFAANTLLAIIWLGASSKAEFASGTVGTPQGPIAVNMMWAVNLQLDCGDPVSTPSSIAIAIDYTNYAGFTWTDFFNGLVHLLVDFIIDALLSAALGMVSTLLGGAIDRVFKKYALIGLREAGRIAFKEGLVDGAKELIPAFKQWGFRQRIVWFRSVWGLLFEKGSATRPEVARELGKTAWDTGSGLSVGGPTGADAPYAPYGNVGEPINNAIDGLFYDAPLQPTVGD
jgi:hypothetical protein